MDEKQDAIKCERGFTFDQEKATAYADWDLTNRINTNLMLSKFLDIVNKNIEDLAMNTGSAVETCGNIRKNVLDVGCGSGAVLDYLVSKLKLQDARKITFRGIDLSDDMINIAKQQYEENSSLIKISRDFSALDMHNMVEIENNSIDFMFSCYVLHFSKMIKELFKHIASKMKSGGKLSALLIGAEPKEGKEFPFAYLGNKWVPLSLPNGVVKNYAHTVNEWVSAMEETGFKVSKILTEKCNYVLAEDYIFKSDIDLMQILIDAEYE